MPITSAKTIGVEEDAAPAEAGAPAADGVAAAAASCLLRLRSFFSFLAADFEGYATPAAAAGCAADAPAAAAAASRSSALANMRFNRCCFTDSNI